MIPRYQRILYWCFVAGIFAMALLIIRGCVNKRERIAAMRDQNPIAAPSDVPDERVSLAQANDADGTITLDQRTLALPQQPALRARVLLDRVLTDLASPNSTHPIPPGPAITDVFFLPLPPRNSSSSSSSSSSSGDAQLAVINFTKAFADSHPSGIAVEDLTLRAILATLHANFPDLQQARFLVDGHPRETLNGHADLSRAYPLTDPTQSIHVLSAEGNPL